MAGKINSKLNAKLNSAKQKTSDLSQNARNKARSAIDASKSAAGKAAGKTVETSKRISSNAKKKTSETVDTSPIAMVAGGIAIGAIVAALLPKTQREKDILGGTSRKINDAAVKAAKAAKAAGAAHMVEVGLDSENLRMQAKDIVQKGYETAKEATKAAQETIKNPSQD